MPASHPLARIVLITCLTLLGFAPVTGAQDVLTRLVYLYVEESSLVASNVRFNRIDELRIQAREDIEQRMTGNAVILVVTNQRFIAYSVFTSAWRTIRRRADEQVVEAEAADDSASVVTSDRYLVFSGRNGVWTERRR